MIDESGEFIWGLLRAAVVLTIVAIFFGVVANTGLAPQPGDPFYVAWLDVTQYGWRALLLVIPGLGAAAYVVLQLLPDSGRF